MLRVCRTGSCSSSFGRAAFFQCGSSRRTISTTSRCRPGCCRFKFHMASDVGMRKTRVSSAAAVRSGCFLYSQNQLRLFATTVVDDSSASSSSSFSFQEDSERKDHHKQQHRQPSSLQSKEQEHTHTPSRQEIVNFANDVLWHTSPEQQRCPLGSMTADLWDASSTAIAYCLESRQENAAAAAGGGHEDDALPYAVVEQVARAGRIVNRLIQEHATQSKASRSWTSALERWKVSLFQAWLQTLDTLLVAPHYPNDDDESAAAAAAAAQHLVLERAEQLWRQIHLGRIMQRRRRRRQKLVFMGAAVAGDDGYGYDNDNDDDNLAMLEFVSLVEAWLRLNTLQGAERAIQLLLWNEIPDLFKKNYADDDAITHRLALIACYHKALQQHVQLCGVSHQSNTSKMDSLLPSSQRQEQRATRQRLVEWMQVLSSGVAGWKELNPNHDLVPESSPSSSSTTTSIIPQQPHDAGDVESFDWQSFEAQVLVKNLMEKVQMAGPGDTEMIHQVIEEWNALSLSSAKIASRPNKNLSNLAGALVDFFIRFDDPENATLWLSRVVIQPYSDENNSSNNDMDTIGFLERRTSAIIALWAQKASTSHTPEAPWRAQDLLTRFEEEEAMLISKRQEKEHRQAESDSSISNNVATGIDHRLYMAVASLWHTSNEPRGAQKTVQLCLDRLAASFHPELLTLAVQILAARTAESQEISTSQHTVSSWEQTSMRKALALFERHHGELKDEATLVSLIRNLQQALAGTIRSSSANSNEEILKVALIGLNHGVMPSPKACELLFSTLNEPDEVVHMVEKVQKAVAKPRIYFYAQAINRLFGMQKKNRGTPLKRIVGEMLLDRIANGTISLENDKDGDSDDEDDASKTANQLRNLLAQTTGMLSYWKRDIDCQKIIETAEAKLMTGMFEPSSLNGESLVPISCYTDMMKILAGRGKRNELVATLQHLVKHYEAGYTSLLPNTSLFRLCMSMVGSSSSQLQGTDKATAALVNVKEQEAMLNQLIGLYKSTRNSPECKPTEDLFAMIMQEMLKAPCTELDAIRAEILINQMISLQVEIKNAATCSLALLVLLSSRTDRIFERSMSIYEKMKSSAATDDKSPTIFEGNNANNTFLFNLIRVCAQCLDHERQQALPIALKAFGQLHERGLADAGKYAFFLQTIGKLIPHNDYASRRQREALLERIFSMACRDGCLSPEVKSLFKRQLSNVQMNRLLLRHGGDAPDASGSREPDEWTLRGDRVPAVRRPRRAPRRDGTTGHNPTSREPQTRDMEDDTEAKEEPEALQDEDESDTTTTTKVEHGQHAQL